MARMVRILLTCFLAASALAQQTQPGGNALANATSRYLRDAAASHVAWKPWGPAAIEFAKKGNRPLFVSVGFASSFEAHRMHREAFNNAEVADSLNGYFVPVLLDRFEHPEVAEALDTLQTSMRGSVTHPSSFILTPALEPIAVTGPLPPRELGVFLATAASRWANQRDAVIAEGKANLVKAHLLGEQRAPGAADAATLDAAIDSVARSFDPNAPRPMAISFALRHATATDNKAVRAAALEALRTFARSTVRDQIGGGFHRTRGVYDKILTDQALFAMVYVEAWQLMREPEFENVVRTTLDYVIRDLHPTKGAFDASQDAHGLVPGQGPEFIEGRFYLWSKDEIVRLVGAEDAKKIFRVYGMAKDDDNLPVLTEPIPDDLKPAVAKLLEYRQKRPEPFREFSHFAGWNGLMISALSRAGAALGEPRYTDAAVAAARTITTKLWNEKKKTLHRSDAATSPVIEGTAEDYAMLVQGLIDLFEASHDVKWLELAKTLQQRQDELFWNPSTGRYTTGSSAPEQFRGLLVESDDTVPSVNALSASSLLRLAMLTGNETWRARPNMIFQSFGVRLRNAGAQLPQLASALSMSFASPKVVVVTGKPRSKEAFEVLRLIHQRWEPLRVVVFVPEKGAERNRVTAALPFAALPPDPELPLTYVCENGECRRQ
jgi:uncharacterized protein